ncbi:hypothetical protein BDV98DRAFT_224003 [Pterulicium gracile]|uniref:Uncharacterized protein n=1 Tax=Pterulicium gracile TaxID=1884261 RepID=A0A5C3QU69_9AGAR|nr:hypothetical protein BDV98DRAFT_224003 [Pterula gracilis]
MLNVDADPDPSSLPSSAQNPSVDNAHHALSLDISEVLSGLHPTPESGPAPSSSSKRKTLSAENPSPAKRSRRTTLSVSYSPRSAQGTEGSITDVDVDDEVLGIGTRIASVGLQIDTGEDIDGLIGPFYYDIKSEARDSVLSMAIDDVGIERSSEDTSNVASRQSSMAIRPARIRRRGRRLSTDLPASARTVTPPLESNQSVKNEEGVGGDQDDDQEMEGDGMD